MRGSAHTVTVGVLRFLPVGSGWVHFVRIGSHDDGLVVGASRVTGPGMSSREDSLALCRSGVPILLLRVVMVVAL